jgi:hypothetical protein
VKKILKVEAVEGPPVSELPQIEEADLDVLIAAVEA